MNNHMDEVTGVMNLSSLAERCASELKKYRRHLPADESFCLEIFRRAIVDNSDQAWSILQQRFEEVIRIWLRSHPSCDVALQNDSEENYVAQTFSRFWFATNNQRIEFQSLSAALSYLHATLNGILIDILRTRVRSKIVPLPEPGFPEEPFVEEDYHGEETWNTIQAMLADDQEKRVAYLLYYCGLKPRDIVKRCPDEFGDVKEVYRLNCNIVDRLRRNRDRLSWLLEAREG